MRRRSSGRFRSRKRIFQRLTRVPDYDVLEEVSVRHFCNANDASKREKHLENATNGGRVSLGFLTVLSVLPGFPDVIKTPLRTFSDALGRTREHSPFPKIREVHEVALASPETYGSRNANGSQISWRYLEIQNEAINTRTPRTFGENFRIRNLAKGTWTSIYHIFVTETRFEVRFLVIRIFVCIHNMYK